MKRIYLYFIVPIIIVSCSKASNPKEMFLKHYAKGQIINKIDCKGSNDQSYCLYMPLAYDINKTFPVIYAFDPHGDGNIPVTLLKEVAEKFNYIVIGSNNCRNGLNQDELNNTLSQLLSDTKTKLAIDTNRIYLIGFSGGARVAAYLAQSIEGVKGIIACSAGFQTGNTAPSYACIGISSNGDMNYLEMRKLEDNLKALKAKSQLLMFEGKHEWPPVNTIKEAFEIMNLYAMHDNSISKDKAFIDEYRNKNTSLAIKLFDTKNTDSIAKGVEILKRTVNVLENLNDISKQNEMLKISEPLLEQYYKDRIEAEIYESKKQQEFMAAFNTKMDDWWNAELTKLDEDQKDKNSNKSNMAKRLKAYISLSCYSYSMRALQSGNWKYASLFTHIYAKVDPLNPDCYYALACLNANTNQQNKAIENLKKAIKLGYSKIGFLANDPLLNPLHALPSFDSIIQSK